MKVDMPLEKETKPDWAYMGNHLGNAHSVIIIIIIDMAAQVQILDKADSISHSTNK